MQNSKETTQELLDTFINNIDEIKKLTDTVALWSTVQMSAEELSLIIQIKSDMLHMDIENQERKKEGLKKILEIMKK